MRIVLHDFGGYPFTAQLARALGARSHEVHYLHAAGFRAPRASLERDDGSISVRGLDPGGKYRHSAGIRRLVHERRYGRMLGAAITELRPDVVISANCPLDAQSRALAAAHDVAAPFVFWMQDVYSAAVGSLLRRQFGPLGSAVGARFAALERDVLARSDAVIAIADDFLPILHRWHIPPARISVIENWAPLEDLPLRERRNAWAIEHGLADVPVILYAGTLGRKHDPSVLVTLAVAHPEAAVVVVAEGAGTERLRGEGAPANLRLLPLQPAAEVPNVLGAADILVGLLDQAAHAFSVPSKVLSYLAAGRPILASMPAANLAARTIAEAGAGVVVEPGDTSGLTAAASELLSDPARRLAIGRAARAYAERTFDISSRAAAFEEILNRLVPQDRVQPISMGDAAGVPDTEALT